MADHSGAGEQRLEGDPLNPAPSTDLASFPLFNAIPEVERLAITACLKPASFAAGQQILREGEAGDALYLIRSGRADVVSRDLLGQDRVLAAYGPGDHFGEMALVTGAPRSATVRASEPVEAYLLSRADFRRVEQTCPAFTAQLSRQVDLLALDAFLKKASPFAHLAPEAIRTLSGQLQAERFPADAVIFNEGDAGDRFYLIRSGTVEISSGGRRLQVMEAGDCFGEVALLATEERTATARALADTEVLTLSKPEFTAVVEQHEALRGQFREFIKIRVGAAIARSVAAADPLSALMPDLAPHRRQRYWLLLLGGIAIFAVLSLLAASFQTGLPVYAAIIAGSFVGPVVYVTYLAESKLLPERPSNLAITFILAAVLGIPLAIYLEVLLGARHGALVPSLLVGVIEESAKVVGVAWLLRRSTARFQLDGMVYGAAAGMGFAAFESVLFGIARIDAIPTLLSTLWVRTLLSPFGHGTWTAIVCGAIWRRKAAASFDPRVYLAFGTSVLLHTLWDWQPVQGILLVAWFLVIGGAGLVVLREMLDAATREAARAVVSLNPEVGQGSGADALQTTCRVCDQVSPPGTHYCVRCGAALRRVG